MTFYPFHTSLCKGRSIMQRIRRNQRTWANSQAFGTLVLQETWKPCEEHPREMPERKWVYVSTACQSLSNINARRPLALEQHRCEQLGSTHRQVFLVNTVTSTHSWGSADEEGELSALICFQRFYVSLQLRLTFIFSLHWY